MRLIYLTSIVIALGTLTGCSTLIGGSSDPAAANERNFQQAMQTLLSKQRACVFAGKLPVRATESLQPKNLEAFVRLGLLEIRDVPHRSPFGSHPVGSDAGETEKAYVLAPGAKQFVRAHDYGYDFCYGDPQLVSIIRWTEPAESFGKIVSEVTYTYRLSGVPEWARSPEFQGLTQLQLVLTDFDSPKERKATLTRTSDGWYSDERWPALTSNLW